MNKMLRNGLLGVMLLAFIGFPLMNPGQYVLQIGVMVFYFALLGTAWTVAGGFTGLFSLGQGAFVGMGAYVSSLLFMHFGISPWFGIFGGMVASGLLAILIGYPVFRFGLRDDYFALITIAFGYVVYEVANGLPGLTGGPQGLSLPLVVKSTIWTMQYSPKPDYFLALCLWAVTIAAAVIVGRSRLGLLMKAVRDDEPSAVRIGVETRRVKLIAFVLSAGLSALAGTLYAQTYLFFDPSSLMSLSVSVQIVLMAVFGGMTSPWGATLGALILVPLDQWLSNALPQSLTGLDFVVYGLILILLMRYMPKGLMGFVKDRWAR